MKLKKPYLIIDLDDNKIIFFVISYKENKDYELIKSIEIDSSGINKGRIVDVDLVTQSIKKTVTNIEDELNCFFSSASVVINPINTNCLNVSGYKKLNGMQVSKEDITYILNDIKKAITTIEDKHSLIHLFNSSFSLDSDNLENLPIGLFGDFYNQNMTFFLVNKNIIKNLKQVFNNCGINLEKIILKSFAEGINLLLKNQSNKSFIVFKLEENRINISVFRNKSYVLTQDFEFGSDLIIKDVSKLCSLRIEEVEFFLKEVNLKFILEKDNESCLDKKYFSSSPYRKIKYQLILDIITARLDEFFEVCCKKNTNLNYFKNNIATIYTMIEKGDYFHNIHHALQRNKLTNPDYIFNKSTAENMLFSSIGAAELIGKGWEKEAIPVIQSKKSAISSFFSSLFS